MSWVAPAVGGFEALTGKKGQQHAQGMANSLTAEQLAQIRAAEPLIAQGEQRALQYDPHAQTEQALNSFDQAANASAQRDYGNAQLPLSLRGFGAGNGSTDSSGFQKEVAAQRGSNRGALAAGLQEGEFGRKTAAMQAGLAPAFSAASALAGPQANYQQQANGWDPSGALNLIGGVNWGNIFKRRSATQPFNYGGAMDPNNAQTDASGNPI